MTVHGIHLRRLCALLAAAAAGAASAAPVTTGLALLWRDHEGPNTVGTGTGDNLTVVVQNVSPNLTTTGVARNTSVTQPVPLLNAFASTQQGFFSRGFVNDVGALGGVLTSPWTATFQNRSDVRSVVTNGLAGVGQLPLLSNLAVGGNPLAPTLTWDPVVTSVPYSQVRISIYDDRTNQVIVNEQQIGSAGLTSYTVPVGTLAPNGNYGFRVFLWDPSGPGGNVINRSSTHVNHTATSTSATSGSVTVTAAGATTPLALAPGANSFPNANVSIGVGPGADPGAATVAAGTTLGATFVNVGVNRIGTLLVNGGTVTMTGGSFFDGVTTSTQGGFATVGRANGGVGYLDISNGGKLQLDSGGLPTTGLNIGREAGSFGSVTVDGAGSSIVVSGVAVPSAVLSENGLVTVGRTGNGRLTVVNGALVENDAQGITTVGRDAGSRGSLYVAGAGSQFKGGSQLNVGVGGEGVVSVQAGGLVSADNILLGAGGLLKGDGGVVNVAGTLTVAGGVIAPGNSPGSLTIQGNLALDSGTLLLEAFGPGQNDSLVVTGDLRIDADAQIDILLDYVPTGPLSLLTAGGMIDIENGFAPNVFSLLDGQSIPGSTVQVQIGNTVFTVQVQGTIASPGTLALLLAGGLIGALQLRARRRR